MDTKICTKCHKEKPLTDFYKDIRGKFNVVSVCKDCHKSPRTKEKEAKRILVSEGFKICNKCKETKPLLEFHINKKTKDGRGYSCKKCCKSPRVKEKEAKLALITPGFKICSKCHQEKPFNSFWKRKATKDGYFHHCIDCMRSPREKIKASIPKGFRICTKCKKQLPLSCFGLDNTVKDKHCSACKSCKIDYDRKYKQTHKRKMKKQRKNYYNLNKKILVKKHTDYCKKRALVDINFRLRKSLSSTLHSALSGNWKSGQTMDLLACSIEYFRQHLEAQFTEGMSWENRGRGWNNKKEWHIDHIYPLASFDLTNLEERKIAFHWSNQQPMWAKDNLKKGDRV
jgi:hypothetical protein